MKELTVKYTRCLSCEDASTCQKCYEMVERELDDLKSKVTFLGSWSPVDDLQHNCSSSLSSSSCSFTYVLLVATNNESRSVPAHKSVLVNRSPVFKAMLETNMEEGKSGIIKINDVSYNVLRSFVHYLYTADASLTEPEACDLLVLAEKYQVNHLKSYCERFMASKVKGENALGTFAFANQQNAKHLSEASLTTIMENMDKLTKQDEYKELVEKDPGLLLDIYEAYIDKHVNTAATAEWNYW